MIDSQEPTYEREAAYVMAWKPDEMNLGIDVGCGDRRADPCLVGIDHHNGEWQDKDGIARHSIADVVADVRNLPYEDGSVDFLVSTHVLEHFADPSVILTEWLRVIRTGGIVAIVVPDWRYTFSCEGEDQKTSEEGHKKDYTLDELCRVALDLPGIELLDARVVNVTQNKAPADKWRSYSVGIAFQKVEDTSL